VSRSSAKSTRSSIEAAAVPWLWGIVEGVELGVGRVFTGVIALMLLGAIVGAVPWCCIKSARLLFEKEGVGTSATIAACASSLITSLMDSAKNLDDSALRATEGCRHVAISVQKASDRDKCSCFAGGKSAALRACSSGKERVRVRDSGGGCEGTTAAKLLEICSVLVVTLEDRGASSALVWYTSSMTFVTNPCCPTR
jgi:hypothetical protein